MREPHELDCVDALVIPGDESTVIGHLLGREGPALGATFHTEIAGDTHVHELLLSALARSG